MQVDADVDLRHVPRADHAYPSGTLGAPDAVRRLAAGVASAFDRAQQAVFERLGLRFQKTADDARDHVRAFVCDGTAAVNLALGTWHWGPYPLSDRVDLLNLQGEGFADDNEVAHLERDLGTLVQIVL